MRVARRFASNQRVSYGFQVNAHKTGVCIYGRPSSVLIFGAVGTGPAVHAQSNTASAFTHPRRTPTVENVGTGWEEATHWEKPSGHLADGP